MNVSDFAVITMTLFAVGGDVEGVSEGLEVGCIVGLLEGKEYTRYEVCKVSKEKRYQNEANKKFGSQLWSAYAWAEIRTIMVKE